MLDIVKTPFRSQFLELCKNAKNSILLCAPFVKQDIVSDVLDKKDEHVSVELVTKISLESFHRKASDCDALQALLSNGSSIYNVGNLHAKVYLFDNTYCYVTSANLTLSGLDRNYEYGIFTDELPVLNTVKSDFSNLVSRPQTGTVTPENIKEIKTILSDLESHEKINYPNLKLGFGTIKAPITKKFKGWKLEVFNLLDAMDKQDFDASCVNLIASELSARFPNNNHPQEKVRQVLQDLRDIGLVEFVSPGKYAKLWE